MKPGNSIFNYPSVKSVVICGDVHGDIKTLAHDVCVLHKMTDTLVIVAGDCGLGFAPFHKYFNKQQSRIIEQLSKHRCFFAFVRGNHDKPSAFDGDIVFPAWLAVPDYSVITACGHQILCVGGAISVDRSTRIEGIDYWKDEQPVFDSIALRKIKESCSIDTVVTHCAPSMCERTTLPDWVLRYQEQDHNLLYALKAERMIMDDLLLRLRKDKHPVRQWFYGHYHDSWQANIEGIDYTMLNIMELKELR